MPHKRAKRSVRESEKEKKGRDLAPKTHAASSDYAEDTPKGAARILNAVRIQADYRERRAAAADGGRVTGRAKDKGKGRAEAAGPGARRAARVGEAGAGAGTSNPKSKAGTSLATPTILPGESIGAFNRRLEAHMRPLVSQAIKDAVAREKAEEREIWMEKKRRREAEKEQRRARGEAARGEGEGEGDEQEGGEGGKKRKRMWAEMKHGKDREEDEGESDKDAPPKKGKTAAKAGQTDGRQAATGTSTAAGPSSQSKSATARPTSGFAPIPAPLPLHDIAMAPPILPSMRRAGKPAAPSHFAVTGRTPLSAGQARLMEEERERVVRRYREIKEAKAVEREAEREAEKKGNGAGGGKSVRKAAVLE